MSPSSVVAQSPRPFPAGVPALRFTAVTKHYGGRAVLPALDLEIAQRETVAVLGANGSGKSTILRVAATLVRPDAGTVELFGANPVHEGETARSSLAAVTQDAPVEGEFTPYEQVEWWLRVRRLPAQAPQVHAALAQAGLASVAHRPTQQLSRGQRQRVALLVALAPNRPLVILDEPFTALDAQGIAWLEAHLAARRGQLATLLALHDETQAVRLADRIIRLGAA